MNKKKILIFSLAYFPRFVGGAEVAIKEITDHLSEHFEFHLITLQFNSDDPRTSKEGVVHVHRVGWGSPNVSVADTFTPRTYLSKILYIPLATLKAWQLNRAFRFDGAWAMMSYMLFPLVLLRFCGVRLPYVVTLQEGDPFEHVFKRWYILPLSFLLRRGFRNAKVVQPISQFLAGWAKEMGARIITMIPNGVDLTRFREKISATRRAELRALMGATAEDQLLISVSRLVHKNGIDTVIEALAQLPAHVRFAVLGDGPDREILQTLAIARAVERRVVWLGEIHNEAVPQYLQAADIFIRPSRSEGQGIAFIEAMAAGLPTVGTPVGGIPDFLHDGETGFLCTPEQPLNVAGTITQIIEHPEETQHIAKGGFDLAQTYGWEALSLRMKKEVFDVVLS